MVFMIRVILLLPLALPFAWCGVPCTVREASNLAFAKLVLKNFDEKSETDTTRQGKQIFDGKRSKFVITTDYGFVTRINLTRAKNLADKWKARGLVPESDVRSVKNAMDSASGRLNSKQQYPRNGESGFYRIATVSLPDDHISMAYGLIKMQPIENAPLTDGESHSLLEYLEYKTVKDFHREVADSVKRFDVDYERCRAQIPPALRDNSPSN